MQIVKECTEFGLDMIRGLPLAYYYTINNIEHKCIVKPNLKPLYDLVSNNVVESADFNIYNPDEMFRYEGPSWITDKWVPPPLKTMFSEYLKFDKPTVVINNKCSVEWLYSSAIKAVSDFNLDNNMEQVIKLDDFDKCSVNHYSMPFLSKIIELLQKKYKVLYIRPVTDKKYFVDSNILIPFNDFDFIEKNYPDVYTIRQFLNSTKLTDNFNFAQYMFESTSDKHLTVAGGNAKVSCYFGGDVIIYLSDIFKLGHHKGNRQIWSTGSWLKKLSNANVIGLNSYDDILDYIKINWL